MYGKGSALSNDIAKPSSSEVKELTRLFPHSFQQTSRKRKSFDPKDELVDIVPDKVKKKKASTSSGRALRVTVCCLSSIRSSIPRGKARSALKDAGRIVDIRLTRSMTAQEARNVINQAFLHVNNREWDYLDSNQDNSLKLSAEQNPGGDVLCNRKGCIYVVDRKVSRVECTHSCGSFCFFRKLV